MRRFSAALATALALVVLPISGAHGAEYVDRDQRGDVHVQLPPDSDECEFMEPELVLDSRIANNDVVRTRIAHT